MSTIMNLTKTVMNNLLHKPVTVSYPAEPVQFTERTRGSVAIQIENCIFCSLCARNCPTGAIHVDRAKKEWSIERFGCIQCRCCVDGCPKKCLDMEPQYTEPAADKRVDVYVQPAKEA